MDGDCLVELGDLEGAESHFASAASRAASGLAAKALSPMCSYKQALVLIELGDEAKAKSVLQDLAEDFPNSTYAANATGLAYSLAP